MGTMNPLVYGLFGAASALGLSTLGSDVIFYANRGDGAPEFRRAAEWAAATLKTRAVYPIGSAAEFIGNLRRHIRTRRFLWIGHGSTRALFVDNGLRIADADALARELAPRLTLGAIVGLAACNAGEDPGEAGWDADAYSDGGARSFAATLRNGIFRRAPWLLLGGVRGHTAAGHTLNNPAARDFPFREYGRAGNGVDLRVPGASPAKWIIGA